MGDLDENMYYVYLLSFAMSTAKKKKLYVYSRSDTLHWQKKMTQMITFYSERMRANTNFFEPKFFFANNLNKFVL